MLMTNSKKILDVRDIFFLFVNVNNFYCNCYPIIDRNNSKSLIKPKKVHLSSVKCYAQKYTNLDHFQGDSSRILVTILRLPVSYAFCPEMRLCPVSEK